MPPLLALSLAVFVPLTSLFFSPSCVCMGKGPHDSFYLPRAPCILPLFIAESSPHVSLLFCPFVTRGCRPSAVFLSPPLLGVHIPRFSIPRQTPLCVFSITRPRVARGMCFECAVRRDFHPTATNGCTMWQTRVSRCFSARRHAAVSCDT